MMPRLRTIRGEWLALAAAALNGMIGPLNRIGFLHEASHNQIAFLKCFGAFLLLTAFAIGDRGLRQRTMALSFRWKELAVLAFLGIFCLYFFETWAFAEASIPLVSFLTYAAGGLALVLSVLLLGERMTRRKAMAFAAIIAGVYIILTHEADVSGSWLGIGLALAGGLGYSLFLIASKHYSIGGGLPQLIWLFGFGSLFLFVPYAIEGVSLPSWQGLLVVAALVLLPTIGGFYFTTHAVDKGEASKVQIIETSDPLFATLFGFMLFGDILTPMGMAGGALILAGLIIALRRASHPARQDVSVTSP